MTTNKWHVITYFALLIGICVGIHIHFSVMPNIVVATLDHKPLFDHKYMVGILNSKAKMVVNANGVTNLGYGWDAIQNFWLLILSVALITLGISIPAARFWWFRAYKKLDRELRTIMSTEIQLAQFEHIEKSVIEQHELKKQYEQDFSKHPEIVKLNSMYAEANTQVSVMNAEITEYKKQIAKLEKNMAKAERKLMRYKKRQDNA